MAWSADTCHHSEHHVDSCMYFLYIYIYMYNDKVVLSETEQNSVPGAIIFVWCTWRLYSITGAFTSSVDGS